MKINGKMSNNEIATFYFVYSINDNIKIVEKLFWKDFYLFKVCIYINNIPTFISNYKL